MFYNRNINIFLFCHTNVEKNIFWIQYNSAQLDKLMRIDKLLFSNKEFI